MKKLLLLIALPLILSAGVNQIKQVDFELSKEVVECKYRQCNAIAKSTGKRCKHCVSSSSDYQCWQHKDK